MNPRNVAIAIVVLIAAAVGLMKLGAPRGGLAHAKNVYQLLVEGKLAAAAYVDWENFNALGFDVGKNYAAYKGKERDSYAQTFVRQLGNNFRAVGGSFTKFVNWRVVKQDATMFQAAADYPDKNKTMLLTFTLKQGAWKLVSLQWSGDEQAAG